MLKYIMFAIVLFFPLSSIALDCTQTDGRYKCDNGMSGRKLATPGYYRASSGKTITSRQYGSDKVYNVTGRGKVVIKENGDVYYNNKKCTKYNYKNELVCK